MSSWRNSDPVRVCVFGSTGSGKTRFLRARFYSWRAAWIDTKLEHEPRGAFVTDDVALAVERMDAERFPVVYRPPDADDDPETDASLVGKMALAVGGCTVVVEEVQTYCRSWTAPRWLARLVRMGRSSRVSLVVTSQRPSDVPRVFGSEATHIVVAGDFVDPADLRYIADVGGPELAERARDNPRSSYLVFNRYTRAVTHEGPGIPGLEAVGGDEPADVERETQGEDEPERPELVEDQLDQDEDPADTLDVVGAPG